MERYEQTPPIVMPPLGGRSVLIEQACELLGVSKRTIYYWIRAGRLQTIRTLGGSQRVLLASIDNLERTRMAEESSVLGAPRSQAVIPL